MKDQSHVEMSANSSREGGGEVENMGSTGKVEKTCLDKVIDKKEAKEQALFALPMILTNAFYYLIPLISVMYAGHLGELQLAGSTLANSWSIVTGMALMTGLSGSLETLCGQAFGAGEYRMLGIYLQASSLISIIFAAIVSVIWFFTEPILVLLRQEHDIARTSGIYLRYMIPGIFAYGLLQNMLRFLQTQSVVWPLILLSGIPTAIHVGVAYALVYKTSLGLKGAALSASISLWLSTVVLIVYVLCSKKFKQTLEGISFEAFSHVLPSLKLAIPSAAMICLEYWAFEILVLLAGMMPNSEVTTSLVAMCVNTEAIAFMLVYGLSAAVSTRVSNELGAGNPGKAKHAMFVTLKLSVFLALAIIVALVFGHKGWASLFSDSQNIIKAFTMMMPLLAISIGLDTFQAILSGVARGCGWQNVAGFGNLVTFYFIGMPIAVLLGFKAKLHARGLWIGLICGLFCQGCTLLFVSLRRKWTKLSVAENGETRNADGA